MRFTILAAALAILISGSAGAQITKPFGSFTVPAVEAVSDQAWVPVIVESDAVIWGICVTLDYDSTVVDFDAVELGSDVLDAWEVNRINDNQHAVAECRGADGMKRVTVTACDLRIDHGQAGEFEALRFAFRRLAPGDARLSLPVACAAASWWAPNHASTLDGYPLVPFGPCDNLELQVGGLLFHGMVGIRPDAWTAVKELFR